MNCWDNVINGPLLRHVNKCAYFKILNMPIHYKRNQNSINDFKKINMIFRNKYSLV